MSGHDVKTAEIIVLADNEAIARSMADWLLARALEKEGTFVVALSGGTTPKRLFEILASKDYATRFPWERTQLFYGDERYVPLEDPSNNYAMSNRTLLSHVNIPPENVHRMPTESDPEKDAATYERDLKATYGADKLEPGRPLFDVVMLGLGDNGHTASLFPRQPVLQEKTRWVAPCTPDDAPHTRLTLTYPAIASSRHVVFLLAGAGKREAFAKVRRGEASEPASHITTEGEMIFMIDRAAAGEG